MYLTYAICEFLESLAVGIVNVNAGMFLMDVDHLMSHRGYQDLVPPDILAREYDMMDAADHLVMGKAVFLSDHGKPDVLRCGQIPL